ncbi:neurofilament heavy polypeptide-like isoform X2 [Physella acuta]|nr:neurofilament heavy polypeptide-like isoform X2 [Physella acuta]
MDDDFIQRPRKPRSKDSFQMELKAKIKERKTKGLAADVTDTDEDALDSPKDEYSSYKNRPGSAKRRLDQPSEFSKGIGTTTMGSRDLKKLLGHKSFGSDDEDEEVASTFGNTGGKGLWQPPGLKTPSPQQESKFLRKNHKTPKEPLVDSIGGRKTPLNESLTKEEIIFGRKTPSEGKKSPSDGLFQRLNGSDGVTDKQWHPPNFRNVSPNSSVEPNKGSHGVTPVDSMLDTISETPREKMTPRIQRGQKTDTSPRSTYIDEKPKPTARNKELNRTSPSLDISRNEKRSTPTSSVGRTSPAYLDLFGHSRTSGKEELESYMSDKKLNKDKNSFSRQSTSSSPTRESKREQIRSKSPESTSKSVLEERKTPNSFRKDFTGRKTPTESKSELKNRKSPMDKKYEEEKKSPETPSLLDLMTGTDTSVEPKPSARSRKSKFSDQQEDREEKKSMKSSISRDGSIEDKMSSKLPSKSNNDLRKIPSVISPLKYKQPNPEETSSICEEIPPDPNKHVSKAVSEKMSTDREKTESFIDTVAGAQTMQYISPAKKIRPVTAGAKVEHRPKPRYGLLPGQTIKQSPEERQFSSTSDIREAIYLEWYQEHLKSARKKKKEEEMKAKEEEEKKKKEKEEKDLNALKSYQSWMENKKEAILSEKAKKEKEEMKKKEKERLDNEQKKEEAQKSFESWKKKKDVVIKKDIKVKLKEKQKEEEEMKQTKREKEKDNLSAFNKW